MIRDAVSDYKGLDHDPDFHWRGTNVTRIENLSDIAFAIALGMIVSSAEAPQTFGELKNFLFYLIPTAAGFAVMLQIWTAHFTFFRRYGVADRKIIFLNACLIFVVLYLAHPLRFTFESLYSWIVGISTGDYSKAVEMEMIGGAASLTVCFFVFAYAMCLCLLALMYRHVIKKHETISLDKNELLITRISYFGHWWSVLIALLVIPIALFTPLGPFSAFLLFLQTPGQKWLSHYYHKKAET